MSKLADARRACSACEASFPVDGRAPAGLSGGRVPIGDCIAVSSVMLSRSRRLGCLKSSWSFSKVSSPTSSSPLCVLRSRGPVSSVKIICFSAASRMAAYSRCLSSLAISSASMLTRSSAFRLPDRRRSTRTVFFLTLNIMARILIKYGEDEPVGSP